MRRSNAALLWLLGAVVLATACALLAPLGWPFELFSHFRPQCAVAALLLGVLLAWRRLPAPAVLALLLAGWHAVPSVRASLAAAPAHACDGPGFTVATVNVQYSNTQHDAFRAWLDSQPADFVVVQEVTKAWAAELESQDRYPYRYMLTREDPYGLAVLSRRPLESVSRVDLAGDGLPSLAVVGEAGGQRIRFLALHTRWPLTPGLARARDEALHGAAQLARAADLPVVLLGDLNLTRDSPDFERLVGQSGLRDVMQGRGWQPTWLARFWPLALRIDHILVSPGVCVEQAAVGPEIGSDHRPVIARLRL